MLAWRRLRPSHRTCPGPPNTAPLMRVSGERSSRICGGTGPTPSASHNPSGSVPSMTPMSAMITSWFGACEGRHRSIERPAALSGLSPSFASRSVSPQPHPESPRGPGSASSWGHCTPGFPSALSAAGWPMAANALRSVSISKRLSARRWVLLRTSLGVPSRPPSRRHSASQ